MKFSAEMVEYSDMDRKKVSTTSKINYCNLLCSYK